jgi:hypothetical protein
MTLNIVFNNICNFNQPDYQSDTETTKHVEKINDHFKLPIFYNEHKVALKQNIIDDLELIQTIDISCSPVYHHLLNTNNELSNKVAAQMSMYYTSDVSFLNDTQLLLQEYKSIDSLLLNTDKKYVNILEIWSEIKGDTGFKEKYQYIDWTMFEFLNKSEIFLQMMSVYNLISPIISLCLPIFILIIPFFIIQMKGLAVTFSEYIEILTTVIENHAIGKLFTKFHLLTTNEKVYCTISAVFYLFSIYQNILVCIRFNHNMIKIHAHLQAVRIYLENTIQSMHNYLAYSTKLHTHDEFNKHMCEQMNTLDEYKTKLMGVSDYACTNYNKILEIGHTLKSFYELYDNKIYNNAFLYSFGFNGYIDCLEGLIHNIAENKINLCSFIDKKESVLRQSYYGPLKNDNPVKNTIKFKKNLIITGPNASGKTTVLKSAIINIIFSQQFGCGFYDSAKINPYKYIHCYLNIPDTSGRDSLFQAEARRCKSIIDSVNNHPDDTHFCIFDELYSGTNPDEAVLSAKSFMEYLMKNKNVSCLLTTHFIKLCKKLQSNKRITNHHMHSTITNDKIHYSYLLKKGISRVKGGVHVLTDMNYPQEIIDNSK